MTVLKQDQNLRIIQESVQRKPLRKSVNVSIPAGGSASAVIDVPNDHFYVIKSWTVTKGTNVTVNSITLDGADTFEIGDVTDAKARYGGLLTADSNVTITGTNAAASAETLEIQIDGYYID